MNTPNIVVVTGTDIGVGKTCTGCALARALRQAGRRVVAIKPLETGCEQSPRESEDGVALARASGQTEPACGVDLAILAGTAVPGAGKTTLRPRHCHRGIVECRDPVSGSCGRSSTDPSRRCAHCSP